MSRNKEEGLSIGQEKELLDKFTNAGISPKEAQAIITAPDNILAKKLVEIANEYAQDKKAEYERLFEGQLETLTNGVGYFGYPTSVIALLEAQKERVIETALELNGKVISEEEHSFLPVIPREFKSAFDQFYDLGITPRIDMTQVVYFEEVPKLPYYIFNVKFDATDKGVSPEDMRFALKTEEYPERWGMTDVELAALLRHCGQGKEKKVVNAVNTTYSVDDNEYVVGTTLGYEGGDEICGHSWTYSWVEGKVNVCAPSVAKRLIPALTKSEIEYCLAQGR